MLLDFGCGDGLSAWMLAAEGARPWVLTDVSMAGLRAAREARHPLLVQAIGAALPFRTGHFETVVAVFVFHFRSAWAALPEIARYHVPGRDVVLQHLRSGGGRV